MSETSRRLGTSQARVLDIVKTAGINGATASEVEQAYPGFNAGHQRLSELNDMRLITYKHKNKDELERRLSTLGKLQYVYVAVEYVDKNPEEELY